MDSGRLLFLCGIRTIEKEKHRVYQTTCKSKFHLWWKYTGLKKKHAIQSAQFWVQVHLDRFFMKISDPPLLEFFGRCHPPLKKGGERTRPTLKKNVSGPPDYFLLFTTTFTVTFFRRHPAALFFQCRPISLKIIIFSFRTHALKNINPF